jgi:hypothetical protein
MTECQSPPKLTQGDVKIAMAKGDHAQADNELQAPAREAKAVITAADLLYPPESGAFGKPTSIPESRKGFDDFNTSNFAAELMKNGTSAEEHKRNSRERDSLVMSRHSRNEHNNQHLIDLSLARSELNQEVDRFPIVTNLAHVPRPAAVAGEARPDDRDAAPPQQSRLLMSSLGSSKANFRVQLIKANSSILIFTLTHLLTWLLFLGYKGYALLHDKDAEESYEEWISCVFQHFTGDTTDQWKTICGKVPPKRIPYSISVIYFACMALYGFIISAMHFWTIASRALRVLLTLYDCLSLSYSTVTLRSALTCIFCCCLCSDEDLLGSHYAVENVQQQRAPVLAPLQMPNPLNPADPVADSAPPHEAKIGGLFQPFVDLLSATRPRVAPRASRSAPGPLSAPEPGQMTR